MTEDPVELDERRSAAGKMASEMRRQSIREFEADQEALRLRQEELETQLMAEPSRTWTEVAAKAQYLIRLYSRTPDAQDVRRKKLIDRALGDLARLMAKEPED